MRRFNVLVGTIPVIGDSVLLLQRSLREKFMPGAWGLPCGKIDFGEDLHTAAIRELKEEAGLDGVIERLVGYSTFMSTKDEDELHNLQINFVMSVTTVDVTLDKSNDAFEWVPLVDLAKYNLDEFTLSTIRQAFPGD